MITTQAAPKKTISHDSLQSKCFLWAWNTHPELRKLMWHTPNELPRRKGESETSFKKRLNQRKAIGIVPGVLDLTFYFNGVLHVFDIKVGRDRLSDDQELFIERVESQGGKAYEIRSLEQFQSVFTEIVTR